MILVDKQIKALCTDGKHMITPFVDHQVKAYPEGRGKLLSYGLSSAGYDVRLASEYKVFTNINNVVIDPLAFDSASLVDKSGDTCIVPPNSYILGRTIETFEIPDDVLVVCVGKSTYARVGILINTTPIEPGFVGQIVIEIANCTSLPIKVHANQGIAQFLFFKASMACEVSYAKKKYQNQMGITLARL
jgi:dCTP deaminase